MIFLFLLPVLLVVILTYLFWPVSSRLLPSRPAPATSYADAVKRVAALQAAETDLNPVCQAMLLTQGQKVGRVIILVHGYTQCPAQYSDLAPQIFELGYNVLLVPFPHHGLPDRMNDDQSRLTASEITSYADLVVDIAQGLGDQVIMMGLSLGGVTTGWAIQNRADLYRGIVLSPVFGFKIIPAWVTLPIMRVFNLMPNSYRWWNPERKDAPGLIPYAYPRYATRSLAQTLLVGFSVISASRYNPIKAKSVIMVTNANDESVNLDLAAEVTRNWKKLAPQDVTSFEFPAHLKIKHDLIDCNQEVDVSHLVYPKLIELIQAP